MSIRCGNCGERHQDVATIKLCYAGAAVPANGERRARTADERLASDYRPNKFAGVCCLCGNGVPEGEGRVDKRDSGTGWNVSHLSGECPAPVEKPAPTALDHADRPDFSAVPGGYYATESATGNNDYDFWYVKEGRKPGYRFVKQVIGGQGNIRITTGEAISALRAILAEGIEKCGIRFADEFCRCWKCGLPLTDELSRQRRQGPICWEK